MTLTEALAENKLPDFVAQEEERGIGPISHPRFVSQASALIKALRLEDQPSHFACVDESSEK